MVMMRMAECHPPPAVIIPQVPMSLWRILEPSQVTIINTREMCLASEDTFHILIKWYDILGWQIAHISPSSGQQTKNCRVCDGIHSSNNTVIYPARPIEHQERCEIGPKPKWRDYWRVSVDVRVWLAQLRFERISWEKKQVWIFIEQHVVWFDRS